jgi:hypothetical protein
MATTVYLLCAVTSGACALLLIAEYRRSRQRLLLWSSIAFVGFALNNMLVFADYVLVPAHDLAIVRATVALAAVGVLLYSFVWDQV